MQATKTPPSVRVTGLEGKEADSFCICFCNEAGIRCWSKRWACHSAGSSEDAISQERSKQELDLSRRSRDLVHFAQRYVPASSTAPGVDQLDIL